ncbi:hypothetical protein BCV72DRAFT_326522 [Rhizopus microsporus var. microsporus]|uniref:Uncharacterized protein n=1 Tax=Rhizopus microsporus var. microsporus TaxID=86635 RepID=A0A1X0R6B9_RHIZD|nr:hypothetical protein BCV72DRAFT_326522 [Rhizopus microsporus var. microsporus]
MPTYSVNVFLCLKCGHVWADYPKRASAAKRHRNGRSVACSSSSTQPVSSESEITEPETSSGENDDLTSIPKFKGAIQRSEVSEEATPLARNPSHLNSKYVSVESCGQSVQEAGQNSPSPTSQPPSLVSVTVEVRSDDEMEAVSYSSEHLGKPNEASSNH